MNLVYLDTLPIVNNQFITDQEENEKIVFAAELNLFGTAQGRLLGGENSRLVLTNKRIIADNGAGRWTINIPEDAVSYKKVEKGKFIFKELYHLIMLNKTISFGDDLSQTLDGFRFYFKKKDGEQFEEIMRNLFGMV